jgi:DNA-binding PadR family transcriptional regulator
MLELAILGLLQERELHGYEIRKRLRDDLGLLSNVSFGSLYPALSRLERSGAVESTGDEGGLVEVRVPMTGSLSGERAAMRSRRAAATRGRRGRKVYRITARGRALFAELLERDPGTGGDDARTFGLRLAFARHLPPAARLRLLDRRRSQLADQLDAIRAAASVRKDLDPYAQSLIEYTADSTEREIRWLEQLISRERSGSPGEGPPNRATSPESALGGPNHIERSALADADDRSAPADDLEGATS